jgi:aryl-alcohol dehydrogenase-like predicted oxidoreductase
MMERRTLGRSGLELSVVGLGTWVFGGRWGGADDADSKAAVHAALDAGVNWIDTADIYGQGRAERIVGEVVRERGDEVLVATKGGVAWEFGPDGLRIWREARGDYLRMACERSLTALGLDHIDLYQVHWPVDGVPAQETMEAMLDLQRRGLVRAIGVSNYARADLEAAAAAGRFDSYQPGYHMMRRQVEQAELPWCAENEVGVIAYGPLAHGLFTGRMDAATTFPENDWRASSEFFTDEAYPERVAAVRELAKVADDGGRPGGIAELAVMWVLRRPEVTSAIIGGRNAEQARANAALAGRPLSADEEAAIDAILAAHPGVDRPYGHGEPAQRDPMED